MTLIFIMTGGVTPPRRMRLDLFFAIFLQIFPSFSLFVSPFLFSFFVAPALAGRHRRASFRPFVRSSVRTSVRPSVHPQQLTWVSRERNSSYSFAPIVLKLCMCLPHGMRMCMCIGHNCWINFCHFFDIVNLVIFHPDYIDRGYLL